MGTVSEILPQRFLIDLVWIDRLTINLQVADDTEHPLEQKFSATVMAIEKNDKPKLPLREATYELEFKGVSGFIMNLPLDLDEASLDMDVDDVTLQERASGVSTLRFENANTTITIDFREVTRTLIAVKECER
jgi:hypothetical protein